MRQIANSALKGNVPAQRELLRQYHFEKSTGVAAEEINRLDFSFLSNEELEVLGRLYSKCDTQQRFDFDKEMEAARMAAKEEREA